MNWRASIAFGTSLILLGLVLVPFIWECGAGISGWNVLIFGLIAIGSSSLGSATGRATAQRVLGIVVTVIGVLASLLVIGALTSGSCS